MRILTILLSTATIAGFLAPMARADAVEGASLSALPVLGLVPVIPAGSSLVVAVLAGVVLAIAFQMILTNLSVAAGISLIGPFDEDDKGKSRRGTAPSAEEVFEEVREVTGAFGLWAVITTSLAMLFACWLAVSLSLTDSVLIGATLGLVVWGLFYIVLTTIEATAISSAVGALFRLAMSGFRTVASATSSLFDTDRQATADAGGGMTDAVAGVLQREGDVQRIRRDLRDYLRKAAVGNPELNFDDVRDDVSLMIHDPKAGAEALRDRWQAMDRDTLRSLIASSRSDISERDAETLLTQLESTRDEALAQADKLKAKARRELRRARREAMEQAEEVRKVAAEAAWWAFGTAAISGAAAVVGGVLGATEIFGDPRDRIIDQTPADVVAPAIPDRADSDVDQGEGEGEGEGEGDATNSVPTNPRPAIDEAPVDPAADRTEPESEVGPAESEAGDGTIKILNDPAPVDPGTADPGSGAEPPAAEAEPEGTAPDPAVAPAPAQVPEQENTAPDPAVTPAPAQVPVEENPAGVNK